MKPEGVGVVPGRTAKVLAVLSVVCFWLLPFSPWFAVGAVSKTEGTVGGWRRLALGGAALCAAYTVVMALVVVGVSLRIRS